MPSPGIAPQGEALLARRRDALPVVAGKHACHSELTTDADAARTIQDRAQPAV